MLVLSRKKNEEINIGEDITIMVVKVKDGRVHLGITAPKFLSVDRAEIREAKRADRDTAKDAGRHIVVWYGQIGCQWIVSLQIEPGIRQRISQDKSKISAIAKAEIEGTMRGLVVRVIEPEAAAI